MNKSSSLKNIFIFVLICAFLVLYLGSTANIKKLNAQVKDLNAQIELQSENYETLKNTTISKTDYDNLVKSKNDLQLELDSLKENAVSKSEYDKTVERYESRVDSLLEERASLRLSICYCTYMLNNNAVYFEYEYFPKNGTREDFISELSSCVTSIYVTYNEKRVESTEDTFTSALKENGAVLHIEFTNNLEKNIKCGVMFNGQRVHYAYDALENGSMSLSWVVADMSAQSLGNDSGDIYSINIRYIEQ